MKRNRKRAQNPLSGQTCGQVRKMGLFNPQSREEQARFVYHENTRFREDLRENKRKSEVRYEPPILGKREDIDIMNRAGFKLEMLVSKQKVFHHLMGSAQLNKKAA